MLSDSSTETGQSYITHLTYSRNTKMQVEISLSRRQLVQMLADYFRGDVLIPSSPGIAAIPSFKLNAANLLHRMPDDTDDTDMAVDIVARNIFGEIRDTEIDRKYYHNHINKDICSRFQSDSLTDLLSKISTKLQVPSLL